MRAVKEAHKHSNMIGILSQRKTETEDPLPDEMYKIGTVARVVKMIHSNDGSLTAILQGRFRFELEERSEEHTSELQSRGHLVCRLLLEKKTNCQVDTLYSTEYE